MARTITEIHNQILANMASNPVLGSVNNTSLTGRLRLFSYIIAVAIQLLEKIFDKHLEEVVNIIFQQKWGTVRWYRKRVLAFQFGFDLSIDTDRFINANATDEEIEASKVIKHCAVVEPLSNSSLIIKVATEENGELAPTSPEIQTALEYYIDEFRVAGTRVDLVNQLGDILLPYVDVYRDPLVIGADGVNILTGENTVEIAIKQYLRNVGFNGELVVLDLAKAIQAVEGVVTVEIENIEVSYIERQSNTYGDALPISVKFIPESGYFLVNDFSNINYVV